MPLSVGQTLQGRYTIHALLGQGGMGSVYRAFDQTLNRAVAIKERVPDPNATPQGLAQTRSQFQREAQVLANLHHDNLPRVTDYFSFGGNEYLVMDLIEGIGLDQVVQQNGAINEGAVRAWMNQILDALMYIHSQSPPIIHRDIKPANIILKPDGKVALVDFGLVKLLDPNNPRTLSAMRAMGTPEYAPIEQFSPGMHTDARSDIYSLGATMYHLLSGRAPLDVPHRLVDPTPMPNLRAINSKISPQTEWVVQKAMEIQPQNRFASAAEMKPALATTNVPAQTPTIPVSAPAIPVSKPVNNFPQMIIGKDGKQMILIPAGEFEMGSNQEALDEQPVHTVYLDAFHVDRTPVTNMEYSYFLNANPQYPIPRNWDRHRRSFAQGKENHPVVYVSWDDANTYARWAGKRLPTEAEWEKAASWDNILAKKRRYPWGDIFDQRRCNSWEGWHYETTPVDKFLGGASPPGVLDMVGNVWEWCADWYDEDYYPNSPRSNPAGPPLGVERVLRGSAWYYFPFDVCTSIRMDDTPCNRFDNVGFRCAQ